MTKSKFFLIVLLLLFVVGGFYWFQLRPSQIRSYCHKRIVDLAGEVEKLTSERAIAGYKALFDRCLNEHGLK